MSDFDSLESRVREKVASLPATPTAEPGRAALGQTPEGGGERGKELRSQPPQPALALAHIPEIAALLAEFHHVEHMDRMAPLLRRLLSEAAPEGPPAAKASAAQVEQQVDDLIVVLGHLRDELNAENWWSEVPVTPEMHG